MGCFSDHEFWTKQTKRARENHQKLKCYAPTQTIGGQSNETIEENGHQLVHNDDSV